MNPFPDKLILEALDMRGGKRIYRLFRRYRYISSKGIIHAPEGMETDGASIPRVFWNILSPDGDYFGAAVIHDWLYSKNNFEFDRLESDLIFKEAMFNIGVPWYRREAIYRAVRMFGYRHFKGPS